MRVSELGRGPRVVLVHGSVGNGQSTWAAQLPLAERFTLVVLDRPGFPPNPGVASVDFEEHARLVAELVQDGDHLVGHSYGGVITLFTAALRADAVRSLCVIEPPAFGIARGRPEVDAFMELIHEHWERGPREPEAFLRVFLTHVGGSPDRIPSPLPPELEQGARTLMVERLPSEAEPPLQRLAAAPFPKLVVSGAHHPAFDAVCDVLERELEAERVVLPGAGHAVQRLGEPFNERLTDFLERAERA